MGGGRKKSRTPSSRDEVLEQVRGFQQKKNWRKKGVGIRRREKEGNRRRPLKATRNEKARV